VPLTNYWGYSTVGFFAPQTTYCVSPASGSHLREFRDMVKALHKAGIEVILDVVYNHTDEGNHLGPAFSFKGIDNRTYYFLAPWDLQYYMDFSGCENTFNCNHPIRGARTGSPARIRRSCGKSNWMTTWPTPK